MRYLLILFLLTSINVYGQTAHEYICNKFDGRISEKIEERDFAGTAYKCIVKEQWDIQIQSKINDLILNDSNFDHARDWDKTYVAPDTYNRRAFSLDLDNFYIVNVYIPYETKTDHFFIAN